MSSRFRPTPSMVVSMVALFVALGGSAYALSDGFIGSDGLIHGCVSSHGSLVLVQKGHPCKAGTHAISWIHKAPTHVQSASTATNAQKLGGKAPSSFANVGSDAFTAPTLNDGNGGDDCNWINYGNGQQDAGYFRDAFGVVHLKGIVVAQDGSVQSCGDFENDLSIFTLPAGYQPDMQWAEAAISNDQAARININPTGRVEIEDGFPSFDNAKLSVLLDGLSFRCAPSGANGCP